MLRCDFSRMKLHKKTDPLTVMEKLPGVSIIKPLMGVDTFLEGNLESHFSLTYPKVSGLDGCLNSLKMLEFIKSS